MSKLSRSLIVSALCLWQWSAPYAADLTALIAVEPTARKDALLVSRQDIAAQLGKVLNQPVSASSSDDLTDAMRATRTGEHAVFIAPAQVAASALLRGYELVGSTQPGEQFVLVGKRQLASTESLRGARIYLPQQDSLNTYMARGMLNAGGLSFKDLRKVEYARIPQAGLTAVQIGAADATVVSLSDWNEWSRAHPGVGKVLATSRPVPGGYSVVVKKDLSADVRNKVTRWFATSAQTAGLKPPVQQADLADYRAVAELGFFTPTQLPGAVVVGAAEVQQLMADGAVLVDTRTEKEFKAKRVPGAVFVPYVEKSLKDVAFDASQDDFSGLASLDKTKPTIFSCNGAECWKSYKASKLALANGFRKVYWFRGGLPEWEANRQLLALN